MPTKKHEELAMPFTPTLVVGLLTQQTDEYLSLVSEYIYVWFVFLLCVVLITGLYVDYIALHGVITAPALRPWRLWFVPREASVWESPIRQHRVQLRCERPPCVLQSVA